MTDVESAIKAKIIEQFNIDISKNELMPDTNLQSIGMDSIKFIKLIVEIESIFDIEYPDDKLLITKSGTLNQIVAVVEKCLT